MLSKKGSNSGSWSDNLHNSEYALRALGNRLNKSAKSIASTTSTVDTTDFDSSFSSSRHQGSFGDSFSSRNEESSGPFSFQGGGPPDLDRCGPQRGNNRHNNDEDLDGDCFLEQSSTNLFWSNDIIESSKKAIDSRGHAWRVKKAKRGMAIPPPPMEDDDEDNGFAVVYMASDSASGRNSKGVQPMTGSPQLVDERHRSRRSSGSLKDVQEEDYQEDVDDSLSKSFGEDSKSTENKSARPKSDQRSSKQFEDKMSDGVGDDFQTYTTNCQDQISDSQPVAKSRRQIKSKDIGRKSMPQPSKSGRKKKQEEETRTRRHRSTSRDSLVISDNEDTPPRTFSKSKSGRKKNQEEETRTRRHRSTSRDSLVISDNEDTLPRTFSKSKSGRKKNQEEESRTRRHRSTSRDSLVISENEDTPRRTISKGRSSREKNQEEAIRTSHRSTSRDSLGPSENDSPTPTSKCKSSRKKNREEKARRTRRRSTSRDSVGSSESDSPTTATTKSGLQKNKEGVSRRFDASGDRKDSTSMPAIDIEEQAIVQKLASAVLNGQVFDNADDVGSLENLVRGLEDALHIAKQALSMRDLKVEYIDTLHKDQGKRDLKRGMSLPVISTASTRPIHGPVPIALVEQENSDGEMPSKKGFRSLFRSLRSPRGVEEGGPAEASGRARRRSVESDSRRRVTNNQRD